MAIMPLKQDNLPAEDDPRTFKHGKLPARYDARTLRFSDYVGGLPAPPSFVDNARGVGTWEMFGNNTIGDCTCAAAGHLIQLWTKNRDIPAREIVDAYEAVSGYRRGDSSTDQGATKLEVLNYWRKHGIAGLKIMGYLAIEPRNHDQVRDTVQCFGGAYIGLMLPLSAEAQLRYPLEDTVWSVPLGGPSGEGAPRSWEGHSVAVVGYDHRFLSVVTWKYVFKITWQFLDVYCDEAYAVLAHEWLEARGGLPEGFNSARWDRDLNQVTDALPLLA